MPALPSLSAPPAGQLVFASDRTGDLAVFAVDQPGAAAERWSPVDGAAWFPGPAAGSHLTLLRAWDGPGEQHLEQLFLRSLDGKMEAVGDPARAVRNPAWSGDGAVLAYESAAAGFRDVWTVRPGAEPVQRTAAEAGCFEPQVVGDPAQLVMVCSGRDPDLRVVPLSAEAPVAAPAWLMERRGEDLRPTPGGPGGRLAFYAQLDRALTVWTVQPDGLGAGPAWRPEGDAVLVAEQPPAWSPDGRTLAVVVRARSGTPAVWLLQFSGSGPPEAQGRRVPGLPEGAGAESPAWLPDGTLLVAVDDGGDVDIWRVDPRSGGTEVWVTGSGTDWLPRWWPDATSASP